MLKTAPQSARANQKVKAPKYAYRKQGEFSVTEIVQSITNGLPIKSVDPDLYPYIYPVLKSRKTHLVQENNIFAARAVNDAIREINLYYYKQNKKLEAQKLKEKEKEENEGNENTENEENDNSTDEFTQEDLNDAVHLALNEQYDQIDPHIYESLTKELRRQQQKAIRQANFQKAGVFDETARRILVLDSEIKYNEITSSRAQEYTQKAQILKTGVSDLKGDREAKLAEERRKRDEDISEMRKGLMEKIQDFDKKYDVELDDIPLQFKKFSSTYLNMRVQEKFLMKSKRYEDATAMKQQADLLQSEEEAMFRVRYEADLDSKRNEIIKQAENQIYAREETANRRFLKIEKDYQREIENSEKALSHCENHATEMEQLAAVANPTAPTSARSNYNPNNSSNRTIPQSARAGTLRRSTKSTRKDRRSVRTARDLRTPQDISFERDSVDAFKQRRAINNIMYSSRGLPSIRKSVP
ncbi:hypothetical protein M9Y10_016595 [Tritrichomonas musculus]|uniref:Uncharacterized protein n=1 Tax=Tritrichomonas musculus TaxID=1915356 RepID=A0ABR2HWS7_9EUKA